MIDRLEQKLPAALFRAEWAALSEGKDPKVYKPFTATEQGVSRIFIAAYALTSTGAVVWLIARYL